MNRMEQIAYLNRRLLEEMPEYRDQAARFSREERDLRRLLRSLMNLRPPLPLDAEFIAVQDNVQNQAVVILRQAIIQGILPVLDHIHRILLPAEKGLQHHGHLRLVIGY